ncbi:hypothetical protein [Thalassospira xiamenensis]|uniref:hypothetical protein n=1 Tax=Thalassospira xiamenensis TaxID=220697 RepID=UPI00215D751A|nr:hypothetical protein [Thalassospira xiamenensis]
MLSAAGSFVVSVGVGSAMPSGVIWERISVGTYWFNTGSASRHQRARVSHPITSAPAIISTNKRMALPPRFFPAGLALSETFLSEADFWFIPGLISGFMPDGLPSDFVLSLFVVPLVSVFEAEAGFAFSVALGLVSDF